MFDFIPQWFQIFFLFMVPWLEARYVIPFSMLRYGWEWWQAFPLAIAGNMFPIPFILLFFRYVEKFLRKFTFWAKIMDWLFARTRKKADSRIRTYQYLGLFAFVALSVPFTGAWTGALIAYLFDLKILQISARYLHWTNSCCSDYDYTYPLHQLDAYLSWYQHQGITHG